MSPRSRKSAVDSGPQRGQDLGTRRKKGMGISTKFTLAVSIVVALVFVLMGQWINNLVVTRQEAQFNAQGIFAARIAAAPEVGSWLEDYDTLANLYTRTADIEAALAIANQSNNHGNSGETSTAQAQAIAAKQRRFDDSQRSYNRRRLRDLVGSRGALDLWVVDENDEKVNSATGGDPAVRLGERTRSASSEGTEIIQGSFQKKGGAWEFARFFIHPIRDRNQEVTGHVWLAFSEKELRKTKDDLSSTILGFCIAGVLIGGLVAFLVSRSVTGPLAALMRDLAIVAGGDLEHRTRPKSNDEVGALAVAFDQMTRNREEAEEMRADLADKDHQINVAHEVQERLFPSGFPQSAGLSIDASCRLSGDLSADLFDTVELEDGCVGLLVMTASGRGIPAAIVLSMARSIFRSVAREHETPSMALRAINRILAPDLRRGMFVSAFYAIIDPENGKCALASAGHRIPALHFIAEKGGLRAVHPDGMAIGLDKGPVFDRDLCEESFVLAPGDRLVLATEGATQLTARDGETLGQKRFLQLVLRSSKAHAGVAPLFEEIESLLAEDAGDHDLTVAMVTRDA